MILPAYGFVESPCRVREVLWQLAFGNKDYLTGKRVGKVATEYAIRSERTECAKVDFLTERLSGIVWARENTCREVLHPDNLVFGERIFLAIARMSSHLYGVPFSAP